MKQFRVEDDYQPAAWIGSRPLQATLVLVILHTAAMLAGVILAATGHSVWLDAGAFSSAWVTGQFQIWRTVTYAFLHGPSLWFALEMLMLYLFGREVERYLGLRRFLVLYGAALLAPPAGLLLLSPVMQSALAGSSILHLGIFLAFAILYPRVEVFFGIQARWVAAVLAGISLLQSLAGRDTEGVIALCVTALVAWRVLYASGVSNALALAESLRLSKPTPAPPPRLAPPPTASLEDIDPLLEKISREGLGSLSPAERRRLESAREALLRRGH